MQHHSRLLAAGGRREVVYCTTSGIERAPGGI
jgi:hypothetical protein